MGGTWEPYPTCQDDPRETQDGCNPCPGPLGAFRNRTAEAGAGGSPRNGGSNKGAGSNNIPGAGGRKQGGGKGSAAGPRKGSAQKPRTSPRKSGGGGGRKQGGGGRKQGGGNRKQGGEAGSCPGEELQACIDVCPGFNARVFGACVAGCAKRCAK